MNLREKMANNMAAVFKTKGFSPLAMTDAILSAIRSDFGIVQRVATNHDRSRRDQGMTAPPFHGSMLDIKAAMQVMNDQRKDSAQNLRLGDFIKILEERPQDQTISFDFCGFAPKKFDSYRGYYEDLSLSPSDETYSKVKVADVLADAKAAMGKTFTGYKGGEFLMDADTLLWTSPYGESHSTAIIDVTGDDFETIIVTAWIRHTLGE